MTEPKESFRKLLEDFQDYLTTGYREDHKVSPGSSRRAELARVAEEIHQCRRCPLGATRITAVPGEGALDPLVMLIGEGPGEEEDKTGHPFIGRAGQYLDKWLSSIALDREKDCFIGNVVKCRPPGNRDPEPEEWSLCLPYLERQIDLLRPRIILTLGRVAGQILTNSTGSLSSLRGNTYTYRGIPLIPTYHPSGVLRNPEYRKPVWDDLRRLRSMIDEL